MNVPELRMNKQKNILTDERKSENYIPGGINAGGIMSTICKCAQYVYYHWPILNAKSI